MTIRTLAMRGFTLIELLIVMVIMSILAAIAYPLYQQQVIQTRRTEAKTTLMNTAQALERCYTRFGRYDAAACTVAFPISTEQGFYTVANVGTITAAGFTLAATPSGPQVDDTRCGVLRLTSTGQRGSLNQVTDANNCW